MFVIRSIVLLSCFLIVLVPVCFATELNLTYDANGNLVTGDGKFRVYNSLNQLSKVYNGSSAVPANLLQEYIYHPTEERVLIKKTYDGGALKETVIYLNKNYVRVINSSGTFDTTYIYQEGQLVAQKNPDGSKYFIASDNLGSNTVVTDESGTVVENTSYSPMGQVLEGGRASRYGYEAKEHDTVVGDTDFNFRKYKPEWALFTQPDTVIPNVYDPQSLNRYMFERGNSYKNVDENGHELVSLYAAYMIVESAADIASIGIDIIDYKENPNNVNKAILVLDVFDLVTANPIPGPLGQYAKPFLEKLFKEGLRTQSFTSAGFDILYDYEEEKRKEKEETKIKKALFIDNSGNLNQFSIKENAQNIRIRKTGGGTWNNVEIVGYTEDGTPVYGTPGTVYNPSKPNDEDSNEDNTKDSKK